MFDVQVRAEAETETETQTQTQGKAMVGSRVYVGGLPFGVRERDLEKFFKGFGRTRDILIKNGYGFVEFEDYRDADDAVYELNGKELLGERVVVEPARGIERRRDHRDDWRRPPRYGDKVSVERARGTPRGADMWRDYGRYGAPPPRRARSRDKYGKNPVYGPPTRTEFRLIVENLSSRISWQDLKDFMRQAGEVTYADAHKQRKNEGVVEFATLADMRNALEKLDNSELNGRRLRLVEDRRGGRGGRRSRSSSSRSRSRSRRRSRSRSRSRSRRSSRSRSRSNSKTRPKSKSPVVKSRSRSKQRSASPVSRSRSRSRSKSANSRTSPHNSRERSRSLSKEKSKSKSRSPTPNDNKDNGATSDHNESVED